MKKVIIVLLSLLVLSSNVGLAQTHKTIKPSHRVSRVKMKGKKVINYYALSSKERTQLTLVGPGKLEVLLRVRLEDTTKASLPYIVQSVLDDKKSKIDSIGSEKVSHKLTYVNTKLIGKPSQASKIHIHIPPGKHTVKFYKGKTEQKIHAEFKYTKDKNEPKWKELTPDLALDTVRIKYLNEKGVIKKYYRITAQKPFVLHSEDSLQLKLVVKAELDVKDQFGSPLILEIKENGKVVKSFKVTGKKSQKTEYVDEKKLIPGNSNVIYFDGPKGKHTYQIALTDKKKSAILLVDYDAKIIDKPSK